MVKSIRTHDEFYLNPKEFKVKQCFKDIVKLLDINEKKNYLDVGCSNGSFLNYLKQKIHPESSLTGFDIDQNLLNKAKSNVPGVKFYKQNIVDTIPEKFKKSFDYISLLVVHTIFDDLVPLIKATSLYLKDSVKIIVFGSFNKSDYDLIARVRRPGVRDFEIGFNRHSLKSLEKASNSCGFKDFFVKQFFMREKIEKSTDPLRSYHSYFDEDNLENSILRNDIELFCTQFIVIIN
tara:strand:- start:1697 stop:2401 length:705 start_codon:yes stop_codon:yes gene_type:complete